MSHGSPGKPPTKVVIILQRLVLALCALLFVVLLLAVALIPLSALPAFSQLEPTLIAVFKTFDLTLTDARMILLFALVFPLILVMLQNSIFKPYLKLLEAREAVTVGAEQIVHDLRQQHDELQQQLESKLAATRLAALHKKSQTLKEARQKAAEIIAGAEEQAKNKVNSERERIKADFLKAKQAILAENAPLADALVEKIKCVGAQ